MNCNDTANGMLIQTGTMVHYTFPLGLGDACGVKQLTTVLSPCVKPKKITAQWQSSSVGLGWQPILVGLGRQKTFY